MKIAIISRSRIEDRTYWSGLIEKIFYSLKSMKDVRIIKIDNLNNSIRKIYAIKRELLKYTKNIKYDESYNKTVSKNFAYQIKKKLKKIEKVDCILCFDSSLIAHLEIDIPIILWTDVMYLDYYNHYFKKQNISSKTLKSIKYIENLAVRKCKQIILPTKWAIECAKLRHKKYSKKFCLIPFGSNLKRTIDKKKIDQIIKQKLRKHLTFVTLSVDWKRKGINQILILKENLESRGIQVKLIIIGAKKFNILDYKNVKIVPFINKNKRGADKKISNFLLKSHFNLLFSSAEAYGIALIEANSRGVPNLVFRIGGMQNIIKNEINGKIFNENEKVDVIANYVKNTFLDKKKYYKLANSSYNHFNKFYSDEIIYNSFIKLIKKQLR